MTNGPIHVWTGRIVDDVSLKRLDSPSGRRNRLGVGVGGGVVPGGFVLLFSVPGKDDGATHAAGPARRRGCTGIARRQCRLDRASAATVPFGRFFPSNTAAVLPVRLSSRPLAIIICSTARTFAPDGFFSFRVVFVFAAGLRVNGKSGRDPVEYRQHVDRINLRPKFVNVSRVFRLRTLFRRHLSMVFFF